MHEPLINEHGFKYYNKKPPEYVQAESIKDFLQLWHLARTWKKENIRRHIGLKYLIHNPYVDVYWYRELHELTNLKRLQTYINDKNVYFLKEIES